MTARLLCLLLLVCLSVQQQENNTNSLIIYAAPTGAPAPDCGDVTSPCGGLEQAVQAAVFQQTNLTFANTTVLMLPGTYNLNQTLSVPAPISFQSLQGSLRTNVFAGVESVKWQFNFFTEEEELTITLSGLSLNRVGIAWNAPEQMGFSKYNVTLNDIKFTQMSDKKLTLLSITSAVHSFVVDDLSIRSVTAHAFMYATELRVATMTNVVLYGGATSYTAFYLLVPTSVGSFQVDLDLRWENWKVQNFGSSYQNFLFTGQDGSTVLRNVTFGDIAGMASAQAIITSYAPLVVDSCTFDTVNCEQAIFAIQTLILVDSVFRRLTAVGDRPILITIDSAYQGNNTISNCIFEGIRFYDYDIIAYAPGSSNTIMISNNQWHAIYASSLFSVLASIDNFGLNVTDNSFDHIVAPKLFFVDTIDNKGGPFYFLRNTFSYVGVNSDLRVAITENDGIVSIPRLSSRSLVSEYSPFLMQDCSFDNVTIPALVVSGMTVTLTSVTFQNNNATLPMVHVDSSRLSISNCSVTYCLGTNLLDVSETNFTLTDIEFTHNIVYEGVVFVRSGSYGSMNNLVVNRNNGIWFSSSLLLFWNATVEISNIEAEHNTATFGGVIASRGDSNIILTDSHFSRNAARYGASLYLVDRTSATVSNCIFEESEGVTGGAIWTGGYCGGIVSNCTFRNLKSLSTGGALNIIGGTTMEFSESIITNCTAPQGGGIFVGEKAKALFSQLHITYCTAAMSGGAVNIYDNASPQFRNCTVEKCSADSMGGAFYIGGYSTPTLEELLITNNTCPHEGAAVFLDDGTQVTLYEVEISHNEANSSGGAVAMQVDSQASFHSCRIVHNVCHSKGGAVAVFNQAQVKLHANCTINFNTANVGGGFYATDSSTVSIWDSLVHNNTATSRAGGFYLSTSAIVTLNNSTVCFNSALIGPGGGGLITDSTTLLAVDSHFFNNSALYGGGLQILSELPVIMERINFTNNFAWYDGGGMVGGQSSNISCTNCRFESNTAIMGSGGCYHAEDMSYVSLTSCVLQGNKAPIGGAYYIQSGAKLDGLMNFYNWNRADYGGAGFITPKGSMNEVYSYYENNTATQDGGAISLAGPQVQLRNVFIQNNTARVGGGISIAYDLQSYSPSFHNVSIRHNVATNGGGMAFLTSPHSLTNQPLNVTTSTNSTATHLIIRHNTAQLGGGIYVDHLLSSTPMLGPGVVVHDNFAASMGGGIAFGYYDVGYVMMTGGDFNDNVAVDAGSNVGFITIVSTDVAEDFCSSCTFSAPNHTNSSYQNSEGFASLPHSLGFVTPCPNSLYVETGPVMVQVAMFDQFGTMVVGDYLRSHPTSITLVSQGSAFVHCPNCTDHYTALIDDATGVASFESLSFCGDSNSSAQLIFNLTSGLSGLSVPSTSCSVVLYGCPVGQRIVSPDSDTQCATCAKELSWQWLFLIMISIIFGLALVICVIVGAFALYRIQKMRIRKHYEGLEIPDFASKPRPTLEGILANKSITQLAWKDLILGDPIGRGASGLVRRATYRTNDVAVKEMLLTSSEVMHAEALEDFLIEITYMSALKNENVVDFIGIALPPGDDLNIYLVTELMHYGSVRDVLDKKGSNLPFSLRLRLSLDAAKGVEHLHKKNLIHRDLKPQNLLVNKGWVCKVSDFGVSTVRPTVTRAMTCIGTPVYMAPEVLSRNKYSEKADVYSFGVVMCEIFTQLQPYSHAPFDEMNQAQLMYQIVEKEARPSLKRVHPALQQLISDCWNTDPAMRPTITEVVTRLRRLGTIEEFKAPTELIDGNEADDELFLTGFSDATFPTDSTISTMSDDIHILA